jgi:hypothetical protein
MIEEQTTASCPECQAAWDLGYLFCGRCGARLQQDQEEAFQPSLPSPAGGHDDASRQSEAMSDLRDDQNRSQTTGTTRVRPVWLAASAAVVGLAAVTAALLLAGEPELEVVSVDVRIVDEALPGENYHEIHLGYFVELRNTGRRPAGEPTREESLRIAVEPDDTLGRLLADVPAAQGGLPPVASGGKMVLRPGEDGLFRIHYLLGRYDPTDPDEAVEPAAPGDEQRNRILDAALDATLVVYFGQEELHRFPLVPHR